MPPETMSSFVRDLIRQSREQAGLTLKQVAFASGYSPSAIHQYECGHLTVPADYLPGLFRATRDVRLIQFVCPGIKLEPVPRSQSPDRPTRTPPQQAPNPQKTNAALLTGIEKLAQVARYNQRVLEDGVVDEADHHSILAEQDLLNEVAGIIAEHQVQLAEWLHAARLAGDVDDRTRRRRAGP